MQRLKIVFAFLLIGSLRCFAQGKDAQQSWQIGGFFLGGWPPYCVEGSPQLSFHEQLFYSTAFEVGRILTPVCGKSFLTGRGEAVAEVVPFWVAYSPKQLIQIHITQTGDVENAMQPAIVAHGATMTPLLFRWNFEKKHSQRFVPWAQLGSGLLWTSHEFPRGFPGAYTSRINFTPQVDLGESLFVRRIQSLNIGVHIIHISSAGIGEYNPGIPVTIQFGAGYSWWK